MHFLCHLVIIICTLSLSLFHCFLPRLSSLSLSFFLVLFSLFFFHFQLILHIFDSFFLLTHPCNILHSPFYQKRFKENFKNMCKNVCFKIHKQWTWFWISKMCFASKICLANANFVQTTKIHDRKSFAPA